MYKKNIFAVTVFWVSLVFNKQADALFIENLLREPLQFWAQNIPLQLIHSDGFPELVIASSADNSSPVLDGGSGGEPACAQNQEIYRLAELLRRLDITKLRIRLVRDTVRPHNVPYIYEGFSYSQEVEPYVGSGNSMSGREFNDVPFHQQRCERETCVSNNLLLELRFYLHGVEVIIPLQFQLNRQAGAVFWLWSEDYFCAVYGELHCATQRVRRFIDPLGVDVLRNVNNIMTQLSGWPELRQQVVSNSLPFYIPRGLLNQDSVSAYQYPLVSLPRRLTSRGSNAIESDFQSGALDYNLHLPVMGRLSTDAMRITTATRPSIFQPIMDNPGRSAGVGVAVIVLIAALCCYMLACQ